jgi:hypothetical protein
MSYNYQYGDGLVYNQTLPSGNEFVYAVEYTSRETAGVMVSMQRTQLALSLELTVV